MVSNLWEGLHEFIEEHESVDENGRLVCDKCDTEGVGHDLDCEVMKAHETIQSIVDSDEY